MDTPLFLVHICILHKSLRPHQHAGAVFVVFIHDPNRVLNQTMVTVSVKNYSTVYN